MMALSYPDISDYERRNYPFFATFPKLITLGHDFNLSLPSDKTNGFDIIVAHFWSLMSMYIAIEKCT